MSAVMYAAISFFAVYGIVQMIAKGVFSRKLSAINLPNAVSHRVLRVKDCQEQIEGIIRSASVEDIREEFIIIDMDSTDETPFILNRLEKEYNFIKVMTPKEYTEYITKTE